MMPPSPALDVSRVYQHHFAAAGAEPHIQDADLLSLKYTRGTDFAFSSMLMNDVVDGVKLLHNTDAPVPRLMPTAEHFVPFVARMPDVHSAWAGAENSLHIGVGTDRAAQLLNQLLSDELPGGGAVTITAGPSPQPQE